jgi:radical SAM superfamily enzyme YgiQ (UPF0313 family)
MKVLFSNAPWWEGRDGTPPNQCWRAGVRAGSRWPSTGHIAGGPDHFVARGYLPYPYFMGYASTYAARETGADVRFRDSIALRESYDKYFAHLAHERYDYVFFESASSSWENDQRIIAQIREIAPETRIVVTGPIAATRGAEILDAHPVHACIRGEYEKGSVRVIHGESGLLDFDFLTEEEMNAAPYPYYDSLYAKRYWDGCPAGMPFPHAQVWSSRGCPFKCIFCVWPATMTGNDPDGAHTRKVRRYSADYMLGFLSEIVSRHHYRSIYFDDDTFNLGDIHTLAMCGVMRQIGLPWAAMCRADTIEMDTWRVMRESGCFGVKIGFESGNQWVVDNIVNKHLDLAHAAEVVRQLKRLGMTVHGTFTYGLPGETPDQMQDTKRYIASLPLDTYQESGTAVMDGTPLDTLLQQGSLEKYAGAHIAGDFRAESDGSKKIENMLRAAS